MFVVGWKPLMKYHIEVDDEEMREVETDAAGTMALDFPEGRDAGVRITGVPTTLARETVSGLQ
jgi:hypothetical protein